MPADPAPLDHQEGLKEVGRRNCLKKKPYSKNNKDLLTWEEAGEGHDNCCLSGCRPGHHSGVEVCAMMNQQGKWRLLMLVSPVLDLDRDPEVGLSSSSVPKVGRASELLSVSSQPGAVVVANIAGEVVAAVQGDGSVQSTMDETVAAVSGENQLMT